MGAHLDGVLVFVRLLVRVLRQEVPWRARVLGSIELPAPQGQWAVGEPQGEFGQGLVDGIVVLLQVPVVIEVNYGVVVATYCVELNIWNQTQDNGNTRCKTKLEIQLQLKH